ncbi:lysophospholipid acyltransferase 5 [Ischnura elegans]|uniref:lysophospholipid acyltransferase 5 n=1 Tax=Ischnura elegans TaxID=197161 RepID=UPI001ED8BF83|nr:lysophospholipid acyltransferase 5 [Ischnura elegans]
MLKDIATALGATEPALRLLLSLLIGYPIAVFHRYTLYRKNPALQHIFFICCGVGIGFFNYGHEALHSIMSVVVMYITLVAIGGTLLSVYVSFLFNMGYLLFSYYFTGTENYDIKWSMPQCVLALRLMGLTYDIYDGTKQPSELSAEQKKTALSKMPSFLEVAAHTFFPASFLVGPQFPMRRYQDFIAGELRDKETMDPYPTCLVPGFLRGALGAFYLSIFQIGTSYIPDAYLISEGYKALPFWQRLGLLGIWGKLTMYKYISCWLFAEGVCIMSGLTYNGKAESGSYLWNGCANVRIRVFEGAIKFGHFITSFNINTNSWVAQYIYKRLKFLGNRYVSQAAALLFLAVWHGLHSGYYMSFFLEFIIMKFEKDMEYILKQNQKLSQFLETPIVRQVCWVILKIYVTVFMGYCLVPFVFLSYKKWIDMYSSIYFCGHIIYMGWPLYAPLVRLLLPPINKESKRNAHTD